MQNPIGFMHKGVWCGLPLMRSLALWRLADAGITDPMPAPAEPIFRWAAHINATFRMTDARTVLGHGHGVYLEIVEPDENTS